MIWMPRKMRVVAPEDQRKEDLLIALGVVLKGQTATSHGGVNLAVTKQQTDAPATIYQVHDLKTRTVVFTALYGTDGKLTYLDPTPGEWQDALLNWCADERRAAATLNALAGTL